MLESTDRKYDRKGKEASKRCTIKQVTTVGNSESILMRTLGNSTQYTQSYPTRGVWKLGDLYSKFHHNFSEFREYSFPGPFIIKGHLEVTRKYWNIKSSNMGELLNYHISIL